MARKPIAAVDLDGTMARYTSWRGKDRIGRPLGFLAREALIELRRNGYRVVLFTTRARHGKKPIRDWLRRHDLLHLVDDITDRKVPWEILFDDRARHVSPNQDGALIQAIDHYLFEQKLTGGQRGPLPHPRNRLGGLP